MFVDEDCCGDAKLTPVGDTFRSNQGSTSTSDFVEIPLSLIKI